jgi:hypothetical protein
MIHPLPNTVFAPMKPWQRAVAASLLAFSVPGAGLAEIPLDSGGHYSYHEASRDGTGKHYFGREIAHVNPRIPIKPLHKMTQQQAITELEAAGLRWLESKDFLPTQHFMVFEKPAGR